MKTLRIWLLILLAVLLPVRGAVAAAMLCAPASAAHHQELGVHQHQVAQVPMDSAAHHHEHADHADHAQHGHDDEGSSSGSSDKCNLCSACCSVAPMVSSTPAVPVFLGLTEVFFPSISVPAASFLSDGQERPPRIT